MMGPMPGIVDPMDWERGQRDAKVRALEEKLDAATDDAEKRALEQQLREVRKEFRRKMFRQRLRDIFVPGSGP